MEHPTLRTQFLLPFRSRIRTDGAGLLVAVFSVRHAERSIRPYILSLLFSLLTSFIDISFSFDTVASLKHVLHQHASPVGNDLLGAHQFAATM